MFASFNRGVLFALIELVARVEKSAAMDERNVANKIKLKIIFPE
jgi:hypothetical protein